MHGVYDDRSEVGVTLFRSRTTGLWGGFAGLIDDCRMGKVDIVYIALPLRAEGRIGEVLRALADTTATVYLMADFFTYDLLHARWGQLGELPVVSIYDSPHHGVGGWLKRAEDVVIGVFILTLISIPLAVVSVLVKLSSPGPVFFRQRRYGSQWQGNPCVEIRTMTVCEDGARGQTSDEG